MIIFYPTYLYYNKISLIAIFQGLTFLSYLHIVRKDQQTQKQIPNIHIFPPLISCKPPFYILFLYLVIDHKYINTQYFVCNDC